jgi:putative oxidoreductase
MPTDFPSFVMFLARILMGLPFVIAGIRNFRNLDRLTGLMKGRSVPYPRELTIVGVTVQTICGLFIVIGVLVPWAALGEAVFLAAATLLIHPYWVFPKDERGPHINACIVNTSLVGGFLMLFALTV